MSDDTINFQAHQTKGVSVVNTQSVSQLYVEPPGLIVRHVTAQGVGFALWETPTGFKVTRKGRAPGQSYNRQYVEIKHSDAARTLNEYGLVFFAMILREHYGGDPDKYWKKARHG